MDLKIYSSFNPKTPELIARLKEMFEVQDCAVSLHIAATFKDGRITCHVMFPKEKKGVLDGSTS